MRTIIFFIPFLVFNILSAICYTFYGAISGHYKDMTIAEFIKILRF
jgi:hypothetical protein